MKVHLAVTTLLHIAVFKVTMLHIAMCNISGISMLDFNVDVKPTR